MQQSNQLREVSQQSKSHKFNQELRCFEVYTVNLRGDYSMVPVESLKSLLGLILHD